MTAKSKIIIVIISVFVAILHFIIGPDYGGPLKLFISGYLIDLFLPMNLYLLTQLALREKLSLIKSRLLAMVSIFLFGSFVEVLQYYKISFLGSTFDPYDFLMYGAGLLLGLVFDILVIEKLEKKAG